jgi:SOS-response transcriptional repressor LexA
MSIGAIIRGRREELGLTQDRVAAQVGISKPYLSNIETGKAKNPPTDRVLFLLERVLRFGCGQLTKLAHLARTPSDVRQEHELLEAEVQQLRSVLKELFRKVSDLPAAAGALRKETGGMDLDALAKRIREELLPGHAGAASGRESNVRALSAGRAIPVINKVSAGYPHDFTDLDYPPSVADEYVRCADVHDPQAFAARVVGDSMEPAYREGDIVIFSPNSPLHSGDDCFVRFEQEGGTTFKRYYQDDPTTIRLQPLNSKYPAESYPREQITGLWPAVFRMEKLR